MVGTKLRTLLHDGVRSPPFRNVRDLPSLGTWFVVTLHFQLKMRPQNRLFFKVYEANYPKKTNKL